MWVNRFFSRYAPSERPSSPVKKEKQISQSPPPSPPTNDTFVICCKLAINKSHPPDGGSINKIKKIVIYIIIFAN